MTSDRSPADTEPVSNDQLPEFPAKGRQSFTGIRRNLSDSELKSPGVQKMLLDDVDRLEQEVTELKGFRDRYYEAARKSAVLEVKRKTSNAIETVHVACLAIGSVAIAFAPTIWADQPHAEILLGGGIVLLLGALLAKWIQR